MGAAACIRPRAGVAPTPRDPGRPVRVGLLVGAGRVHIGARGRVVAVEDGRVALRMESGESVTVVREGDGIRVVGGGQSVRFGSLRFRPADRNALVIVAGAPYRGSVAVTQGGDGVSLVNELGLEAYVQGVVGAEMGPLAASQSAALEAQAIASRTYAIANLGRFSHQGFDLQAGVSDQVYRGALAETAEGNRAVRNTNGMVIRYAGEPIAVFFHSTCGYATASPEEVFRSVRPTPYLGSVSDRRGRGGGYYCEQSPRFRWRVVWGGEQLSAILRSTVPRSLGVDASRVTGIQDVVVRATGKSGRATEVRVRVEGGEIPVFGPEFRAVFETPEGSPLGSNAVQLSADRSNDRLTRLTAAGAGWGHGVGLCQWGAIGRSRAGQDFGDILSAYFPGTEIAR